MSENSNAPASAPEHWTTPPSHDDALWRYFNEAESSIGFRSSLEPMKAMALAGINSGGTVQTDDRLVRGGVIGVSTIDRGDIDIRIEHNQKTIRDRESAVGRIRRVDAILRQLSNVDFSALKLAYCECGFSGNVKNFILNTQVRAKLGERCGVALLTKKALDMSVVDFERWVLGKKTDPHALSQVKLEAINIFRTAWNRYADIRGRRRRFATEKA